MSEQVNHPKHYNSGKIEVIEFIEDQGWGFAFCLGNAVKYIARAGKKDPARTIEDLEKADWYLKRATEMLKAQREGRDPVRPNDMNPRNIRPTPDPAKRCVYCGDIWEQHLENASHYYDVPNVKRDHTFTASKIKITESKKDIPDRLRGMSCGNCARPIQDHRGPNNTCPNSLGDAVVTFFSETRLRPDGQ